MAKQKEVYSITDECRSVVFCRHCGDIVASVDTKMLDEALKNLNDVIPGAKINIPKVECKICGSEAQLIPSWIASILKTLYDNGFKPKLKKCLQMDSTSLHDTCYRFSIKFSKSDTNKIYNKFVHYVGDDNVKTAIRDSFTRIVINPDKIEYTTYFVIDDIPFIYQTTPGKGSTLYLDTMYLITDNSAVAKEAFVNKFYTALSKIVTAFITD